MAVAPGSIAFVGYSFDNQTSSTNAQGFAFVALEAIPANEAIRFIDGAMARRGDLTVDAQVVWTNTTGAAIPAGTIVQVTMGGYSGANNSSSAGFTTASVNVGSVTAPKASDGTTAALWNVWTNDSLYAVTSTTGTAAATAVAAIVWGETETRGITAGASVLDPGTADTSNDTAVINPATANASYASAADARTAYTDPANWLFDDDSSDDTGTNAAPDWPVLLDSNSPLNGKTTLTVAAPAFSFGDANGLVNAAEATATPVTISGLGSGATAVVTFKSSAGTATVTHTFTANGSANVSLSGLADGTITITNVAVTNAGATTNYASPPASNSVILDKTPPAAPTIGSVADDAGAITGALASGGTTDDTTLTVSGTAAAGASIDILNNGTVVGTATANSSGAWSATTSALSGAVSLTARTADQAGNQASSAAFATTIDTTAPAVTSVAASGTGIANGNGALNAGKTVTLTVSANEALTVTGTPTLTLNNGGTATYTGGSGGNALTFSYTVVAGQDTADLAVTALNLPSGAAVRDAAGNAVTFNAGSVGNPAGTLKIDTVAPAAPSVTGVTDDAGTVTGPVADGARTNDTTPTVAISLSGTNAAAGDTVRLLANGTQVASVTLAAADITAGTVSLTSSALSGDGTKTLTATVTDAAGNVSAASTARSMVLDTTPPAAPSITGVTDDAGTVTGAVTAGASSDDTTPTVAISLSGTGAVAGDTVRLLADGAQVASVTLTAGDITAGSVSLTSSALSGDGAKTLTAQVVDAAGNASTASAGRAVVLDTTAPSAPSITGVTDDAGGVTGPVAPGASSDDATPTVAISLSGTGAVAGDTVKLLVGGVQVASAALTAADIAAGTVSLTASALSGDGSKALTATVTDAAGNVSAASASRSVVLDTTAPAAPAVTGVADNVGASQGNLSSGAATDDNTLTLSGTAEAGATVNIYNNGNTLVGTATANGSGAWSATTSALPEGAASLTARVTDAAGNQGPASTPAFAATVDTAAPAVTSVAASGPGIANGSGALNAGKVVTFTVNAGEALTVTGTPTLTLNNGATATYTGGSGGSALTFGYTVVAGQDTADLAATALNLPNGAAIRDAAGNALAFNAGSVGNPAGTLKIDTTAPTAAPGITGVTDNAGAVTGPVADGARTDDTTPTVALSLSGTGAAAGDTLALFANGAQVASKVLAAADITAGTVSLTSSALSGDGTKTLTAQLVDAAGNASAVSSRAIVLDTTAPVPTSVAASGPGIASGDGALNAGDTVTLTVNASEALTVTGTPTLSLNSGGTATFTGGSGTSTLTFTYTVGAGENAADLAVTALNLPSGAAVRDAAGNAVAVNDPNLANPPGTLRIDTAAPNAPSIASVTDDQAPQTGNVLAGGATNDATPVVRVSLSGTNAAAGDSVQVLSNGASTGGATLTAADVSNGYVDVPAALPGGDGAKSLTATVTDAAGNVSNASGAFGVTLDAAAPSAPAIGSAADDDGPVTGALGAGGTTDDTTPTLSISLPGNAAAGDTVRVFNGSTEVGSHVLTAGDVASGTVSVTTSAMTGDGAKTLTATVTDAAGNQSGAGGFGYTLDTTPPASGGTVTLSNPGGDGIQYGEADNYAFDVSGVSDGTATVTFTSSGGGAPVVVSGLANGTHAVNLGGLPSGTITATISTADAAGNATNGTGDSVQAVTCFYPGTLVAAPGGERAVETLKAGDLVLTAEGEAKPIRWMGRQTVSTRFSDPLRVLPIRVVAGALGENLPVRDLLLSPDHALLVDGVLVQAGALVNGTTIRREARVPEVFTYWHVELADHSLVLAEGVPAETFVDNVERLAFDNWEEHEAAAAGSEAPIAEMALPRAKSVRQVPQATRRRLAERAGLLLGERTAAA